MTQADLKGSGLLPSHSEQTAILQILQESPCHKGGSLTKVEEDPVAQLSAARQRIC